MKKPSDRRKDQENGNYTFNPNSYHKCIVTKQNTDNCVTRWYIDAIECPKEDALVYPEECEKCEYGVAGNYELHWVKCEYEHRLKNSG